MVAAAHREREGLHAIEPRARGVKVSKGRARTRVEVIELAASLVKRAGTVGHRLRGGGACPDLTELAAARQARVGHSGILGESSEPEAAERDLASARNAVLASDLRARGVMALVIDRDRQAGARVAALTCWGRSTTRIALVSLVASLSVGLPDLSLLRFAIGFDLVSEARAWR